MSESENLIKMYERIMKKLMIANYQLLYNNIFLHYGPFILHEAVEEETSVKEIIDIFKKKIFEIEGNHERNHAKTN